MSDGTKIFVDEPASYEPRGDHIVATWKGQDYVMPISIAQLAVAGLTSALAKWRAEHARAILKMAPREH